MCRAPASSVASVSSVFFPTLPGKPSSFVPGTLQLWASAQTVPPAWSPPSLSPHETPPSLKAQPDPSSSQKTLDTQGPRCALSVTLPLLNGLATVRLAQRGGRLATPSATCCLSLCPPTLLGPVPGADGCRGKPAWSMFLELQCTGTDPSPTASPIFP